MFRMNCTYDSLLTDIAREKKHSSKTLKRTRLNLHGSAFRFRPFKNLSGRLPKRASSVLKNRVKIGGKDQNLRKEYKVEENLSPNKQHLRVPCGNISLYITASVCMIVYFNLYNKVLNGNSNEPENPKQKVVCLYCYWQNIRNSDWNFLLEANKNHMFRTYNFLHTCYILYS